MDARRKILRKLRGGGVKLSEKRELSTAAPRRKVEEIWCTVRGKKEKAHLRWYLPTRKGVDGILFVPVSCGCELTKWAKQKGGKIGCQFCTVGRQPFQRYLNPLEILGFVRVGLARADLASRFWGKKNKSLIVTFSSAGEPLLHYGAVKQTIQRLKEIFEENRVKVYFSISTVGIASGIRQMLDDLDFCKEHHVQLRLSMHFPMNGLRSKYMPVRDRLSEVLDLGVEYAKASGIKLIVNWALMREINDQDEHARALIKLLSGKKKHVIVRVSRVNPYRWSSSKRGYFFKEGEFQPSFKKRRKEIVEILRGARVRCASIRKGFVDLACHADHYFR